MSQPITSPQHTQPPSVFSAAFARPFMSAARPDLPSVAQLTRRHTAPNTSPERPPKAPNPNRGHFQPYRPFSSPPSSPNVPFRPPSSRVASTSSVPTRDCNPQLTLPTQPTASDPDAEFVHPPFDKRTNYIFIVSAKNPAKFLDEKDFVDDKGEVIMEYPYQLEPIRGVGGLKPGPVDDKDVLRCTFCRKQYRGKNSKSMWRRHVQKSHKIKLKNYRERNKENEMEEDFMAATPSRPKLSPYPQLPFGAKPEHQQQQQQPVLMLSRMPLLDAVLNKNISPADAKKVAAMAVASVTASASGNPFKMVLKPPIKQEPGSTPLPPAPVVKKESKKSSKSAAPQPRPEPESPPPVEPEFTLSGSDEDDDTVLPKVPCLHSQDIPCEPCVAQFMSLKRGVRRTASMMTLLSPVVPSGGAGMPFFPPALTDDSPPSSPRFDLADVEMSMDGDPDSSQDELAVPAELLIPKVESEDEWLYDPAESETVLESAIPSSPALHGLGFGEFTASLKIEDFAEEAVDFSECEEWLQWDAVVDSIVASAA